MNKENLIRCIIENLTEKERNIKQSLETTRQAVIEAPGAMQSHSDTTKWQMSRRAEAIEQSLLEIQRALAVLKPFADRPPTITKGSNFALIEVENLSDGSRAKYFLLPAGGGDIYEVDGERVIVLTAAAPIAHALIGVVSGDEVEVKVHETTRQFRVFSVS